MGKKRKSYFNAEKSGPKKFKFSNKLKLAANMKGFLISYNCKFTFCINEAKKLIEQFSIQDQEEESKPHSDIEKQLKEELNNLNNKDKEFHVLDTNAKHVLFITAESSDPNLVVESIFQTIEESKKPLGRFVQRIVPVLNTCKAYMEDIEKCIRETLDKVEAVQNSDQSRGDQAVPFTYCCVFKTSNNNQISRENVIKIAGTFMQAKNRAIKVDFDKPDFVLLVHVICNMCYVSFLRKYFDYRKYNLVEMGCKVGAKVESKSAKNDEPADKVEKEEEEESSSEDSHHPDDQLKDENKSELVSN